MRRNFAFIRSVILLIYLVFVANSAMALNQLTNSEFDSDASGWTTEQRLDTFNTPAPTTAIDDDMTELNWSAVNGGCYYVVHQITGWEWDRDANSILDQAFSTPADPVNVRLRFDHRDYYDACDIHWVYGSIRQNSGGHPNQPIVTNFFVDTNHNHEGAWASNNYDVSSLLNPSSNYLYRVYWYFRSDRNDGGGAYVDNLRVDFSPTGLTGSINGTSNELSWDESTTPASDVSLRGTNPYKIYWGTTSGVYTASSSVSTNAFSHTPPAGSVVYYVVTDFDDDDVESPYSVVCPVVRMTVNDGTGADVDTIIGNDIDMNWSHVAVTGFTRTAYQVALGSTPGGSDVAGWVDLPAASTSYTFTGASLTNGNTYYTSVRMVTDRGTLNSCSSDGFVSINLDVRDGSEADIDLTSSLTDADMNWGPAPFAVGRYDVALGTTPGGTDIVGWKNVNLVTSHSFGSLSLNNGGSYYCSVKAFDPSLAEIAVFSSDGFAPIIDTTLTVRDGSDLGVDTDDIFSLTAVGVNWDDSTGLPVLRYEAAIGTTPGGDDVIGWTDMGVATTGTLHGPLATGTTYYSSVRIVHATAGTLPAYSSDGFVCRKFEVRDGPGADIDYTFAADTLQANWDAVTVPFLRYEVAAGTTPGGTDIVGWTSAGTATNYAFSGLPPLVGLPTMYYISVRIIGTGGTPIATSFSNGVYRIIVVDMTVRDGLNPDIEYSFFENRAEMNWDHPSAGIIRYEVALGSSMFSDDVHPFTDVGHARQATLTGFSLASGSRYFATVRGISAVGEVEAFGGSNGFIACRDQVLTDTASQTYFHNARVLRMIDITTDPGSIRPKLFSANGGRTWGRYLVVEVEEPGVTERINAPCRIQLAGLTNVVANAIRVADDQGNEVPLRILSVTGGTAMDLVFLVNMAKQKRHHLLIKDRQEKHLQFPGAYSYVNNMESTH